MGWLLPGRDHIMLSGREARVLAKMGLWVEGRSHIWDEEEGEVGDVGGEEGKRR
jgi:hypothetical protein